MSAVPAAKRALDNLEASRCALGVNAGLIPPVAERVPALIREVESLQRTVENQDRRLRHAEREIDRFERWVKGFRITGRMIRKRDLYDWIRGLRRVVLGGP